MATPRVPPKKPAKPRAKPVRTYPRSSPNKNGRPKALTADEATLKRMESFGEAHNTHRDCATLLHVSLPTFRKFLTIEGVAEAYDLGKARVNLSLRRMQVKMALRGNTTMLVWLGKNLLGQTDRIVNEHGGIGGGPIEHRDLSGYTDEQLAALEVAAAALAGGPAGAGSASQSIPGDDKG